MVVDLVVHIMDLLQLLVQPTQVAVEVAVHIMDRTPQMLKAVMVDLV